MTGPTQHHSSTESGSVSLPPVLFRGAGLLAALCSPFQPRLALTASRWFVTMGMLSCMAAVVGLLCLQIGTQYLSLSEILRLLAGVTFGVDGGIDASSAAGVILVHVRLPRVFLGFVVGSCLAAVGVALQALLRNPLADPYVLGVSSGAALGAAIAVLFGIGSTVLAASVLPVCGFAGGLVALLLVYRMAATYERLPIHSLLLAGVILNAIFSALIMFITSIMEPNRSFGMMAWLMGTLTAPELSTLLMLSIYLTGGMVLLFAQTRALNVMALGEEAARSLGVDTERAKRVIFILSALMTGAVVSVSGMIGFVGMVIPHAVRLMIGADHRLLLPAAALIGGTFLMAADTLARTLWSPAEIPVGIITALAGGPFFVYLLVWRKDRLA